MGALEANLSALLAANCFGPGSASDEGILRRRVHCARSLEAHVHQSDHLLGVSAQARHKPAADYLTTVEPVARAAATACATVAELIARHLAAASAADRSLEAASASAASPDEAESYHTVMWESMIATRMRQAVARFPQITPQLVLAEWSAGSLLGNSVAGAATAGPAVGGPSGVMCC